MSQPYTLSWAGFTVTDSNGNTVPVVYFIYECNPNGQRWCPPISFDPKYPLLPAPGPWASAASDIYTNSWTAAPFPTPTNPNQPTVCWIVLAIGLTSNGYIWGPQSNQQCDF